MLGVRKRREKSFGKRSARATTRLEGGGGAAKAGGDTFFLAEKADTAVNFFSSGCSPTNRGVYSAFSGPCSKEPSGKKDANARYSSCPD